MDPRIEGARDLILAIFRLAVADYLGLAYGHDGPGPVRRTRRAPYKRQAGLFLAGAWASYLGDQVGLPGSAIWRETKKLGGQSVLGRVRCAAMAA